mmetsp:Transcript_79906/g.141060  ORF Transcript_79906/g.141060 Transcript_79906/m.141060 type:complete len:269 (+) Transcript_79906:610-1416(+)
MSVPHPPKVCLEGVPQARHLVSDIQGLCRRSNSYSTVLIVMSFWFTSIWPSSVAPTVAVIMLALLNTLSKMTVPPDLMLIRVAVAASQLVSTTRALLELTSMLFMVPPHTVNVTPSGKARKVLAGPTPMGMLIVLLVLLMAMADVEGFRVAMLPTPSNLLPETALVGLAYVITDCTVLSLAASELIVVPPAAASCTAFRMSNDVLVKVRGPVPMKLTAAENVDVTSVKVMAAAPSKLRSLLTVTMPRNSTLVPLNVVVPEVLKSVLPV